MPLPVLTRLLIGVSCVTASFTLSALPINSSVQQHSAQFFSKNDESINCTRAKLTIPDYVAQVAKQVAAKFSTIKSLDDLDETHRKMVESYWDVVRNGQDTLIKGLSGPIDLDDVSDQSFLPYLLEHELPDVYSALTAKGMPANSVSEDDFMAWIMKTQTPLVSPKGQLYGCVPYAQFDTGWLQTGMNYLSQALGLMDKAPFKTSPGKAHYQGDSLSIVMIGDWGTGTPQAQQTIKSVMALKPDIVIHMGDVYFSGTEVEFNKNFFPFLPPKEKDSPDFFTLNANHEMDGGGWGYFKALEDSRFKKQQNSSFFLLEFKQWTLIGLDSAYNADAPQYSAGRVLDDYQKNLLASQKDKDHLILLSHHNPITPKGDDTTPLWRDVTSIITPAYWYYGHQHIGMAYSDSSAAGIHGTKARVSGFGGIPTGQGSLYFNDFGLLPTIDFYARKPDPARPPQIMTGFLHVQLSENELQETFYDQTGEALWPPRSSKH